MRLSVFYTALILILNACTSKKGCTDPGSITFNPKAKIDDGSCVYPETKLTPLKMVTMEPQLYESSACKYFASRVFTIIDTPEEKSIYSLNMVTGGVKETIEIPLISSVNFEALTASETHFYIGDVGNNNGNRTDLRIYKIPHLANYEALNTINSYEEISFLYPEQTDFRSNTNTNYDCESLMYFNDVLYLFTKNHSDSKTYLYSLPAHAGNYQAQRKGTFDAKGLISDADINIAGNKIALVGHNETSQRAFVWLITDFDPSNILLGNKTLIDIGSIQDVGKVEGVSFYDDNYLFITSEKSTTTDASLYYLDISSIK